MNIPCKLLSPPVLVDSTRFSLYAVTEVSRKPKHTHFKYRFQNIHFLCAIFPRSGGEMELRGFDSAKGLPWRCRARHGGVRQSARHWFGLLRISRRSATTRGGGGARTAVGRAQQRELATKSSSLAMLPSQSVGRHAVVAAMGCCWSLECPALGVRDLCARRRSAARGGAAR